MWMALRMGEGQKEQFKTAADAVVGKHLPTLDQLDDTVNSWRTQTK
jgi:hypothetical protein